MYTSQEPPGPPNTRHFGVSVWQSRKTRARAPLESPVRTAPDAKRPPLGVLRGVKKTAEHPSVVGHRAGGFFPRSKWTRAHPELELSACEGHGPPGKGRTQLEGNHSRGLSRPLQTSNTHVTRANMFWKEVNKQGRFP